MSIQSVIVSGLLKIPLAHSMEKLLRQIHMTLTLAIVVMGFAIASLLLLDVHVVMLMWKGV